MSLGDWLHTTHPTDVLHSMYPIKGLPMRPIKGLFMHPTKVLPHRIKGLRLPVMDPTAIKLQIIAMFEDGVQVLGIKEGHILPALDVATKLQHSKAVTIRMRTRIPTSSVDVRLKDTVTRRPLLTLMMMETPSWVECYKNETDGSQDIASILDGERIDHYEATWLKSYPGSSAFL